jgi:hypothetical protein
MIDLEIAHARPSDHQTPDRKISDRGEADGSCAERESAKRHSAERRRPTSLESPSSRFAAHAVRAFPVAGQT